MYSTVDGQDAAKPPGDKSEPIQKKVVPESKSEAGRSGGAVA